MGDEFERERTLAEAWRKACARRWTVGEHEQGDWTGWSAQSCASCGCEVFEFGKTQASSRCAECGSTEKVWVPLKRAHALLDDTTTREGT
jgi:hypothetical protein